MGPRVRHLPLALLLALLAHGAPDARHQLYYAAEAGDFARVWRAVEEGGADVEAEDIFGRRALHLAAEEGHLEVVQYLAGQRGADVEAKDKAGRRPLHYAAIYGHLEVVQYLAGQRGADVEAKDEAGRRPLHNAARSGYLEVVQYLAGQRGADVEAESKAGRRPLHNAAHSGYLEVVQYLAGQRGADVEAENKAGRRPLHNAARGGHLEVVQYLAGQRGADVEAEDKAGRRPLHYAADEGHLEVVEYLAGQRGADVEAEDKAGWRPLHYAADEGHLEVVEYLLQLLRQQKDPETVMAAQASAAEVALQTESEALRHALLNDTLVNFVNPHGVTSLMLAARHSVFPEGNLKVVEFLIGNPLQNASIAARDHASFTARDYAANFPRVQGLLPEPMLLEVAGELARRPTCWLLALGLCAAGCVALAWPAPVPPRPRADGDGRWARGARLLAARATVPGRLKAAALVFRGAEVTANAVLPMRLAVELPAWLWCGLAAALYAPPAWRHRSFLAAVCPTTTSLLAPAPFAARRVCLGLGRLGLALLAWRLTGQLWAANWAGEHTLGLIRGNAMQPHKCVDLPVGSGLPLVAWDVVQGNCTREPNTRCIRSPDYPKPYPPSEGCKIRTAGWLPLNFPLNVSDFETQKCCDILTVNGVQYSGQAGPEGVLPRGGILWFSDDWIFGRGWELCPRSDHPCLRLPSAAQVFGACEALLALLALAWALAAAAATLAQRLRPPDPEEAAARQDALALAAEIREVLGREPGAEGGGGGGEGGGVRAQLAGLPGPAGAVEPLSKLQLAAAFGPVLADFALDWNVVLVNLRHGDVWFAAFIAGPSLFSTLREFHGTGLRERLADLAETWRTGVPTEGYLGILDQERGFEAIFSLLVTTYALPYMSRTTLETATGVASLMSSIYGVAAYANQMLDLEGLLGPDDEESDGESQGSSDSKTESASEIEATSLSSEAVTCKC